MTMTKAWIAGCILAARAAAWTIDLRNAYEENHKIYLKAGEDLDVLVDGFNGSGYSWMNNIEYAKRNDNELDGHIDFVKEEDYEDEMLDFLDDYEDETAPKGFPMGH